MKVETVECNGVLSEELEDIRETNTNSNTDREPEIDNFNAVFGK